MRFDAYTATIRGQKFPEVAQCIADAVMGTIEKGQSKRRYATVWNVDVGARTAAWVGFDGATGAVYVEGKGETSPMLAKGIRDAFPGHQVPRFDVCEDCDQPGAFEALQAVVRGAKGPRVKGGYVSLPDNVEDGKTWAAGARGGVGYIRVYEAGKHPDRVHLGRPNWARIELEARPHYARDKLAAASMSPVDAWGLSAWTHRVGEAVTQIEIERFEPQVREYSFNKTTLYLATAYRRHFEEMIANGEDLARTFQAIWQEDDRFSLSRGS